MEWFAETAYAIAGRSRKLEKIELLAEYLRTLDDADLAAATRFFTGGPFAQRDHRTLSLGGRAIVDVARKLWNFDAGALRERYRATGDLGSALDALVGQPRDPGLFTDRLTPSSLETLFGEIADASGKNAGKRRAAVLERILRAASSGLVVAYVVKIVTGDLRIGLREGLVVDAIARAFDADSAAVRRAAMAAGDLGEVALAAKHGRLHHLRIDYDTPIGFMLASPIPYGDAYDLESGEWFVEDKYDGIRAQAHVRNGVVRLFSRRFNDVTAAYPEVAAALSALERDVILDGEIVGWRDGRVLPFRMLQTRLQRKRVDPVLLREIPLAYVAFDLLAEGDDLAIDDALAARKDRLAALLAPRERLLLAPYERLAAGDAAAINDRFAAARERGNEGLVLKRTDSAYLPGRRGMWWRKLKRELSTIDAVVVAVEWGNGKRANVLSDYTFAVRGDDGELQALGKAYSGLTDAEIAELTDWFLAHRRDSGRRLARPGEIAVEPKIVIEVAFDVIARSDLHESGFALRFPRIVRIRDDKPVEEIDTLARVRDIYAEVLAREGIEENP